MKYTLSLLALVFVFFSCKENTENAADTEAVESEEMVEENHDDHDHEHPEGEIKPNEAGFFGEEFDLEGSISYEEALEQIAESDSLEVKLHGTVDAVCQVKGCWMTMGDSTNSMRVKFKDYGFFVPMDCMGKTAYISGKMKREIVSVDEQKHYLEDAGAEQSEIDAITEDKEKLTFLATGVKLQ
jgi:hypothetical protein